MPPSVPIGHAEFPAASYLTLVGSYLAAQELHATLTQNLWSDSIALATVLGTQVQPNTQNQIPPAAPPMARAQPVPSR